MKKKIFYFGLCLIIVILIIIFFSGVKNSKLERFKDALDDIINVTDEYYKKCDCDLFGDGPFDIKNGEIEFINYDSIKSGEVTYDGVALYLIEITSDDYCANGILGSYDIYIGECYKGILIENDYTKNR